MNWKKEVFQNFKLYAVTDLVDGDPKALEKIEAAYAGGADIVQLRSKHLTDTEFLDLGKKVRQIADRMQKLFFVNDRFDLALELQADGIHTGQGDMSIDAIRSQLLKLNKELYVGKSTHDMDQAIKAQAEGADYIAVGPVYSTPTKPGKAPVGLGFVKEANDTISLPVVAIGGIDRTNVGQVIQAGARRIAAVRAVFDAADVYQATKELCEILQRELKVHAG